MVSRSLPMRYLLRFDDEHDAAIIYRLTGVGSIDRCFYVPQCRWQWLKQIKWGLSQTCVNHCGFSASSSFGILCGCNRRYGLYLGATCAGTRGNRQGRSLTAGSPKRGAITLKLPTQGGEGGKRW